MVTDCTASQPWASVTVTVYVCQNSGFQYNCGLSAQRRSTGSIWRRAAGNRIYYRAAVVEASSRDSSIQGLKAHPLGSSLVMLNSLAAVRASVTVTV